MGRQTSFARAFFNSSSNSSGLVVDREMAAALAASSSHHETGSGSDSPKSWMEDVRRHSQQLEDETNWPYGAQQQDEPAPFGDREIIEQYRIMAEHEAHRRLKKTTGLDLESNEKTQPVIERVDPSYRRALLSPRLPEPRRVTATTSMPKLLEPTLPSLPRNHINSGCRSQIAPKVLPGVMVKHHNEDLPPEQKEFRCLGCGKKLRVDQKALFASCPNCSAESPAISISNRVTV